ncbi:MAG TPA: SwmB domain-containing protein [Desulfitobacterium sp.]|nr:SwmB domain-containing protein [Desulfitobacterium sp.]
MPIHPAKLKGACELLIEYVQPQVNVLGGEGAVPQRLLDQIDEIIQSNGTTTNPATTNGTFTVSNSSTTGFTLNMYPALNGLTTKNFTLLDRYGNSVALNSAYTSDNGVTYTLSAALNAGQTYTVIASRTGYNFVTAPKVVVPSASTTNETLIVSNPSTTGFTVTVSPALVGLTVHDFKLMDSTASVAITSASVSNSGTTYQLAANLTAGKTYTVTAEKSGYNFGTASYVVVPSAPTVSSAVTSDSWHIVLTMNSQLMGTIGDPEAFIIAGVASNPTVTRVTVSGSTVTLTLSAPIVNTDSFVKVSYTKTGINNLTKGTPVANVYLLAVTNNVE